MKRYQLEVYTNEQGEQPFVGWLDKLKDKTIKTKLAIRLRRLSFGNVGDSKKIKGVKGIFEIREHIGGGYRIYYSIISESIVLLLAGSTKKDQKKTIEKASRYLKDCIRRTKDDK